MSKNIIEQAFEGAGVDFSQGIQGDLAKKAKEAATISAQFLDLYDNIPGNDKQNELINFFSWFAVRYLAEMIQDRPPAHELAIMAEAQGSISLKLIEAARDQENAVSILEDAAGRIDSTFDDLKTFLARI